MKKNGFWVAIFGLVFVLGVSYLCTEYIIPFFREHVSYSESQCLTDNITEGMDAYDIRDMYSQGGAVTRVVIYRGATVVSHGSGVCVASNGYKTTSLETQYTASMGSYYATNYHVIDAVISSSSYSIEVEMEHKDENGDLSYPSYTAKLLWYNKDLDVAIIYSDYNSGYVTMRDNWIDYDQTGRHTESVFTIGTPLDTMHRNRITLGGIASISGIGSFTTTTISGRIVVNNWYEDGMDLNLDIAPGNSGGGVFDDKGRVVGLSTFSMTYDEGGSAALNGAVSIYPVMKTLDKVIVNNEKSSSNKIYDLEKLNIKGYDANEANIIADYSYYLDGAYYTGASLNEYGYYVKSSSCGLTDKMVIKSASINDGGTVKIDDRNDLIYLLLKANAGDKLTVNYRTYGSSNALSSKTITLS